MRKMVTGDKEDSGKEEPQYNWDEESLLKIEDGDEVGWKFSLFIDYD